MFLKVRDIEGEWCLVNVQYTHYVSGIDFEILVAFGSADFLNLSKYKILTIENAIEHVLANPKKVLVVSPDR